MANEYLKKNPSMMGTPRGYVKKKRVAEVDRDMAPILKGAAMALSLTPLGRVVRSGVMAYRGYKAASALSKFKNTAAAVGRTTGRPYSVNGARAAVGGQAKTTVLGNASNVGLGVGSLAAAGAVGAMGYTLSRNSTSKNNSYDRYGNRKTSGSSTSAKSKAAGTLTSPYEPKKSLAKAAGTLTKPYEPKKSLAKAAGTLTKPYEPRSKTAKSEGPGRIGSQTVTTPKRIGVNAAPPGGPPSGARPPVAAAAATAASAVNNKGAAPKGTTPAKRYKNARERRMAERYAIGISGRPM